MYRIKLDKLNKLDQFKELPIDIDRLCRVIKEESYTKKLLSGESYCRKNISDKKHVQKDPYSLYENYINEIKRVPLLLIGCSGVGKSSFIKYHKKNNKRFIRFNLNKKNSHDFGVKNIHIYFFDKLVTIINCEFKTNAPLILFEALSSTDGMYMHHEYMDDYKKGLSGKKYAKSRLITCFEECRKSIFGREDINQLISLNKCLLNILLKNKEYGDGKEIIFAIDNLDRTSNIAYERKLFSSGLLDISSEYIPIKGVKIIVALRRVTFIRHLEGKERLKTWSPEIIFLTPPNPINLLANKILHRDFLEHDTSKTLFTYGNMTVTGRGKNLLIFVIYLCLLLQKRDKETLEGNLLVAVSNESAREMIRMLLSIATDDYTSIQEFNTVRTEKLLKSANEIFDIISKKRSFQLSISWIYGTTELIPSNVVDMLVDDIYLEIKGNHYRHALTDYHLLSMFIRFGYNKYNIKQEGNNSDVNLLLQMCNKSRDNVCQNHTSHYPMPLINVFENRNDNYLYNNFIRFILLRILADKSLTLSEIENTLASISIDKHTIDDIISLFKYKYYIVGENYEFVDKTPIPIMLTRRGELLYTISTWPRYVNNAVNATNICNIKKITSSSDTEHSTILPFFKELRELEIEFFMSLNNEQKRNYNILFDDTHCQYPVSSVFSKRYFAYLFYEINAMIKHSNISEFETTFSEFKDEFSIFLSDNFGYLSDEINLIDTTSRIL